MKLVSYLGKATTPNSLSYFGRTVDHRPHILAHMGLAPENGYSLSTEPSYVYVFTLYILRESMLRVQRLAPV